MKRIDLGQTISILANLGVIAGIMFLAFELQQNNDLLASQARATLLTARVTQQELMATNAGRLAEIVITSRKGEALTTTEMSQLRAYWSLMLYNFAAMHREVVDGPLDETDIPRGQWAANFQVHPNLLEFWEAAKVDFDPAFAQFIEQRVMTYELDPIGGSE